MSDVVDKRIEINMILKAAQALQTVDTLADKLQKIADITKGNSNQFFKGIDAGADQAGKAIDSVSKAAGKAQEEFKTLRQQLREATREYEELYSKSHSPIDDAAVMKSAAKVRELEQAVKSMKMIASNSKGWGNIGEEAIPKTTIEKIKAEQKAIHEAIANARIKGHKELEAELLEEYKSRANILQITQRQVREERSLVELTAEYNKHRNDYMNALKSGDWQGVSNAKAGMKQTGIANGNVSYSHQLSLIRTEAEQLYMSWKKGDAAAGAALDGLIKKAQLVNKESVEFNKVFGIMNRGFYDLNHNIDYFFSKARSHFTWLATGFALHNLLAVPDKAFNDIKKIEVGMAGMIQTLPQLHHDQEALNKLTGDFIGIAAEYGEKIEDIIEAGKLWSRAYKDIHTVQTLIHSSAILAVADNFSMVEANKALEATMMQYGWQARNAAEATAYSMRIVDAWTNIAHNAQVSAQDLAMANERTAAVARMVGVEFETLQGLIAAGVKNTGRSGAEIGNTLKTVFGSIRSDKAVEEIEALGVKMKYVSEDGVERWREVQDVMLDLAVATKTTEKDIEGVMKAAAGGKFQWSKFASMMDYEQIIKGISLAVNSMGIAEQQVEAQLDTISRKIEQLHANLQGLTMNAANAGLAKAIKDSLDGINALLKGLQAIPAEAYTVVGGIGVVAMATYAAGAAFSALLTALVTVNGAQSVTATKAVQTAAALTAEAGAATGAATALRGLAAAETYATGGLNLLFGALITAGLGLVTYAALHKDATSAIEEQREANSRLIAEEQQRIELNKKQVDFIETLGQKYRELSVKLEQVRGDSEKEKRIIHDLETTHQALTDTIGKEAAERVKASNYSIQAIDQENNVHAKAAETMTKNMKELVRVQEELTNKEINAINARIEAIQTEANVYADSMAKKVEALGLFKAVELEWFEQKTWWLETTLAVENKLNEWVPGRKDTPGAKQAQTDLQEKINRSQQSGQYIREQAIKEATNKILGLKTGNNQVVGNFHSGGTLGGNIISGDGTDSGSNTNIAGANTAKSLAEKIERMFIDADLDKKFTEATESARKFESEMSSIASNEKIFGLSQETIDKRTDILTRRLEAVREEIDGKEGALGFKGIAKKYQDEVDAEMKNIPQVQQWLKDANLTWDSLDKETKQNLVQQIASVSAEYSTIGTKLDLANKARVKAAELEKETTKLTNERNENLLITQFQLLKVQGQRIEKENELKDAQLGRFGTWAQRRKNELDKLEAQQRNYEAQLVEMDKPDKEGKTRRGTDEYLEVQVGLEKVKNRLAEIKDVWADVRKEFADALLEMANGQMKFSDFSKKLWNDLAREAVYALMKIPNNQPSILGGLFGNLFKPKTAHTGESVGFPKMHSGGDVMGAPVVPYLRSDEVIRTLQVGEEVNSIRDRRSNEIMAAVAMKAMEQSQQQQQPIIVYAMDAQSIVDFFTRNGELMAAVLRKQGGYGNKL